MSEAMFAKAMTDFNEAQAKVQEHFLNGVAPLIPSPSVPVDHEATERERELAQLAALSPAEYGLARQTASERLKIPLTFLDQEREHRQKAETKAAPGQGTALVFDDIPAAPEPVNGAMLGERLATMFTRYVVLPPHAADALVLWTLFTYCFDEFDIAPRIALESPEKRCGKTTVLSLLRRLAFRAVLSSNVSPATLFRVIAAHTPTLLIDEMDSFADANDELRGILNSGHTRDGATVIRTVGDHHEPRAFSTWAPMAFACIGRLPGTLEDRSIRILMRRKTANERVTQLRQVGPPALALRMELRDLASGIVRWVSDTRPHCRLATPRIPDGLHDRAADNWAPLLAVAELLGDSWPARASAAASALSGQSTIEDESVRVQLLADIQGLFHSTTADRLSSEDLCLQLSQLEERPWAEWRKGKPLTQNQLAGLLRPFGVRSRDSRLADGAVRKGYHFDDFQDAWVRYLPLSPTDSPISKRYSATTRSSPGDSSLFQSATASPCSASKNGTNPAPGAECSAVAVQNPGSEEKEGLFSHWGDSRSSSVEEVDLAD